MKKNLILSGALMISGFVNAQIAQWLIPADYEGIHLAKGADIIITDSLSETIMWTLEGKRLAKTSNTLYPFVENRAVTVKPGSSELPGFFDINGKFYPLGNFQVAHANPFFSNGYLLVIDGYYFRYVSQYGYVGDVRYISAYPFSNGYASCSAYENFEKKKSPFNILMSADFQPITFEYKGKVFDKDDLDFISSVNDEDIGFVVIKKKLYYFNGKDKSISPVFASKDETNIKNQGKLEGELSQHLIAEDDSTYVLWAKCGKTGRVVVRFDKMFVPTSIQYSIDGEVTYHKRSVKEKIPSSPLKFNASANLYGLSWDSKEMLPPQFNKIGTCFGDHAFVNLFGKWGMLKVLKDTSFKLSINKGNDVGFRHQKFETVLRLDVDPHAISAKDIRINIDEKSGCEVDMTSGVWKDTEYGNYVEYNCVLNIPQSLPDEMYGDSRNVIEYPTQILYNNLKSSVIPFKIKAWHYKYLTADIDENERSIQQGVYSFIFNINAQKTPGEVDYPLNAIIQTDSMKIYPEKISETRYKCKDLRLNEGLNNIAIVIQEQGCPPISFPYELYYFKPSAKAKNKENAKERVEVRKKTQKPTPAPKVHWDI